MTDAPFPAGFQVVLLGNYAPARQQSMLRFAEMLQAGWCRRGIATFLIQPEPWLAPRVSGRLRKWAAYLDYYVRFPWRARRLAAAAGWNPSGPTVFHICDHSNVFYLCGLRGCRVVLTCHDLLAVRGARGEPVYCQPSATGYILQTLILFGLGRAPWVACDSAATCADFRRLTGRADDSHVRTIPIAFNAPFARVAPADLPVKLARFPGVLETPYLFHVGSGEARKNRAGAMRALALARPHWPGRLIFAGEPLTEPERAVLRSLNLPTDTVREVTNLSHDELAAFYSGAHALIFPSFAEGFGWPVIEAQACGCPVICSDTTSLPEVSGGAAILRSPGDAGGMAEAIIALTDPGTRASLIAAGLANTARFSEDIMINAYADLYRRALT